MTDEKSSHKKTGKVTIRIEVEQPVPEEVKGNNTTTKKDGSGVNTVKELRTLDAKSSYHQYGDLEAVENHIIDSIDTLTPNGLVASWLSLDVFSRIFAENIVTPEESSDLDKMADRVMDIVLDALDDEFGEDRP